MRLDVREGGIADSAAAARLVTQLGYATSERQARSRIERVTSQPETSLLVAAEEAAVLGLAVLQVCWLIEHDRPVGVLLALVVDETRRRCGIGRALVEAAEARARQRGCFGIVLSSARHRIDADEFYRRMGYDLTGGRFAKQLATEDA